jgi:hypothetical protein
MADSRSLGEKDNKGMKHFFRICNTRDLWNPNTGAHGGEGELVSGSAAPAVAAKTSRVLSPVRSRREFTNVALPLSERLGGNRFVQKLDDRSIDLLGLFLSDGVARAID